MGRISRDRYVDFLRAWAIVMVVLGHWLITALVRDPGGELGAPELLATLPWTQWLTLGFQIMPLFFLAGGHAAAGSWERARAADGTPAGWIRGRALRLLLPATAYASLVLLAVAICSATGVDPDTLALVGWAMAMQFWFLPVYLLLSALTPALHAAHRRLGLAVPLAMGAAALVADALTLAAHIPYVGLLNYVLVWGVAYQLGFCWRDGLPTAHPWLSAALATAGALSFAALITLGPFPVSLILVTGQNPSNTNPPSAAMLAWTVTQTGLCLLAAPALRRLLSRERVWRAVRPTAGAAMTLYLWHMLPVLIVAGALYLPDLAPDPAYGSAEWWLLRVPWLLLLGTVLIAVVRALRPLEHVLARLHEHAHPAANTGKPRRPWLLHVGLLATIPALTSFATQGFAPAGHFPTWPALGLVLGTAMLAFPGGTRPSAPEKPAQRARTAQR